MKEILLVEDSDADADAAQYALKSVGIANPLRRFVNGAEAMAHLNHAEKISAITPALPSVLLVDIKLPGMSGFEILEAIQHRPNSCGGSFGCEPCTQYRVPARQLAAYSPCQLRVAIELHMG